MFTWQFYWYGFKKRLAPALLFLAGTTVLLFLEMWVLDHLLSWKHAFPVQIFSALLGGTFSIIYLLTGLAGGLLIVAMYGVLILINWIPSPWGSILGAVLLSAIPIRNAILKHRSKKQLLHEHFDMTEAQASEIVATAGAVYSGASDDIRREADAVLNAGFLQVEHASLLHSRSYLLAPEEKGVRLYAFDRPERLYHLLLGEPVEASPKDLHLEYDTISGITLTLKRRLGMRQVHVAIHSGQGVQVYAATGSAPAARIAAFFASRCGLPVDNLVRADLEPLVQSHDIVDEIRTADPETVARMRSSRWLNRLMVFLSILSFPIMWIAAGYPPLYFSVILCPIAVTVFYIRRQETVRFDGSRQGKPSVIFAYLCNPGLSTLLLTGVLGRLGWAPSIFRYWSAGLAGAAIVLFSLLYFVEEHRGKIGRKAGIVFVSMLFGLQIAQICALTYRWSLARTLSSLAG